MRKWLNHADYRDCAILEKVTPRGIEQTGRPRGYWFRWVSWCILGAL